MFALILEIRLECRWGQSPASYQRGYPPAEDRMFNVAKSSAAGIQELKPPGRKSHRPYQATQVEELFQNDEFINFRWSEIRLLPEIRQSPRLKDGALFCQEVSAPGSLMRGHLNAGGVSNSSVSALRHREASFQITRLLRELPLISPTALPVVVESNREPG